MRTLKTLNLAVAGMAAAALAGIAPVTAHAQDPMGEPDFTNLGSYSIAIPIGDTHRFTPGVSWFGASWEGQWLMRPRTVAGAAVTINDFYDVTHGTTNFSSGSATGLQSRDLLVVSALGTGRWYLDKAACRGPYVGLGAGIQYQQQYYQLGVNSQFARGGVALVFTPEFGVVTPVMEGVELVISARYNAPTPGGDYVGGGSRRFQFLSLSFGLTEH